MTFGIHNHTPEFAVIDGALVYEELLKLTDPSVVVFEMDCGWVYASGHNPVDYLSKTPERFPLLHVKDMVRVPVSYTHLQGEGKRGLCGKSRLEGRRMEGSVSGAPADSMLLVDTGRRGEREWCSLDGSVIMMPEMTRRDFVRLGAGAAVTGAVVKATLLEPPVLAAQTAATGRKIRFVSIGTGIRGCDLLRSARKVPTGELVATADLYEMHRKAGLEAYGQEAVSYTHLSSRRRRAS